MPVIKIINSSVESYGLPSNSPLTELIPHLVFGCRNAACGACAIEVIDGVNNLSPMQEKERHFLTSIGMETGSYRLACQCKVLGNITIKSC